MRSINIEETAMIICNMCYKLVNELKLGKSGFYANANANSTDIITEEKAYCSVVKKVKKENITNENIGEIMLCQIPGVSSITALAILAKFKTLPNLIKCIKEDETCMSDVCIIDSNGKSRKMNKTAIATIINFLHS
jgi:ERCC4-type nuclease